MHAFLFAPVEEVPFRSPGRPASAIDFICFSESASLGLQMLPSPCPKEALTFLFYERGHC